MACQCGSHLRGCRSHFHPRATLESCEHDDGWISEGSLELKDSIHTVGGQGRTVYSYLELLFFFF